MENNDIELMLRFKEGDNSAFEALLDKYEKPALNFIYRMVGNTGDAEDLTQELFFRIYHSAKKYNPTAKFSTWLFKIAYNLTIDFIRKNKNKIFGTESVLYEGNDGDDKREEIEKHDELPIDQKIENKKIGKKINSYLYKLPYKQKTALILKIFEDKSYKEISDIIGCSIPAVESLLFRARETLKTQLSTLLHGK